MQNYLYLDNMFLLREGKRHEYSVICSYIRGGRCILWKGTTPDGRYVMLGLDISIVSA